MPIRPENKSLYPSDWKQIRERIQERAGNKCEICGVHNHDVGVRMPTTKEFVSLKCGGWSVGETFQLTAIVELKVFKIVCTVMHLNHDPTDNRDENLKFGCQKCHNNYDREFRTANRIKNKQQGVSIEKS